MTQTATKQAMTSTREGKTEDTLLDKTIHVTEQRRQTITGRAARRLGVEPNNVIPLMRSLWRVSKGQPELTEHELFVGLSLVAKYNLDPTCKEIYVTRGNDGKLMVVVGIDGWVKILDRTPHYDGFEQELHVGDGGAIDWVETKIYSTKRSKPSVYRAFAWEYAAVGGFMRSKIPAHMLRLFSLRHAARLFAPIGGHVVDPVEAEAMQRSDAVANDPALSRAEQLADTLRQRQQAGSDTHLHEADQGPQDTPASEGDTQDQSSTPAAHLATQAAQEPLTAESITNDMDRCKTSAEINATLKRLLAEAGSDDKVAAWISQEADRRQVELQPTKRR